MYPLLQLLKAQPEPHVAYETFPSFAAQADLFPSRTFVFMLQILLFNTQTFGAKEGEIILETT